MKKVKRNIATLIRGLKTLFEIEKVYALLHVVTSAISPLQPFINIVMMAKILNELVDGKNLYILILYSIITVTANFVFLLVTSGLNHIKNYHLEQFYKSEKMLFAKKTMDMDYESVENSKIHALLERIKNENQNGFNMFFLNMFSGQLISSIASIIVASSLSITLFFDSALSIGIRLFIVSVIFFVILINYYTTRKSNQENMVMFDCLVPYNAKFNFYNDYYQDYNAGKEVRLYKMDEFIAKEQAEQNRILNDLLLKTKLKTLKYVILGSFSSSMLNTGIYIFVIFACISGSVLIGDIAKYVSCIGLFVSTVGGMISQTQSLFNNNKYLENYFQYFDIPSMIESNTSDSLHVESDSKYEIQFVNVSFKYPDTNSYVLNNISITLNFGERIAIVGVNGSGKTTMIKLLCRLYAPTKGTILLNGIDIREYDYGEYISIFSVVFQDFKLFAFPIANNIAAASSYDEKRVWAAIAKAGLEKRIKEMPGGITTPLYKDFDEDGIEISGGEAQKIAIARALYKNAPILILDEPTAALDPVSEHDVYSKFNEIVEEKTAIFISHRLASCTFSDRILVFHDGQIVQEGTHKDLLCDKAGKYYELWTAQAQHYKHGN